MQSEHSGLHPDSSSLVNFCIHRLFLETEECVHLQTLNKNKNYFSDFRNGIFVLGWVFSSTF